MPIRQENKENAYIGIDPSAIGGSGEGGAIVAITESGTFIAIRLAKQTERDIWNQFKELTRKYNCYMVIEKVASRPGQGVSSTFKFGTGYGFLRALLIAGEHPFVGVTPSKWQKTFGTFPKEYKDRKRALKAKAQNIFPKEKIINANADAALLAYYSKTVAWTEKKII